VQRFGLPVLCCDACCLIHFLLACLISTAGYRGFSVLSFPLAVVLVFESRWLPCLLIFFCAHSRMGRLLSDFLARVRTWDFSFRCSCADFSFAFVFVRRVLSRRPVSYFDGFKISQARAHIHSSSKPNQFCPFSSSISFPSIFLPPSCAW
jgi:hypothetical protein